MNHTAPVLPTPSIHHTVARCSPRHPHPLPPHRVNICDARHVVVFVHRNSTHCFLNYGTTCDATTMCSTDPRLSVCRCDAAGGGDGGGRQGDGRGRAGAPVRRPHAQLRRVSAGAVPAGAPTPLRQWHLRRHRLRWGQNRGYILSKFRQFIWELAAGWERVRSVPVLVMSRTALHAKAPTPLYATARNHFSSSFLEKSSIQ